MSDTKIIITKQSNEVSSYWRENVAIAHNSIDESFLAPERFSLRNLAGVRDYGSFNRPTVLSPMLPKYNIPLRSTTLAISA